MPDSGRADWDWLRARKIQHVVATYFGLTCAEIRGPKRHKPVTRARMMAMGITRELTSFSYPRIGAYFGGRNHTTVIHADRKFQRLLQHEDPDAVRLIALVRRRLEIKPTPDPPEPGDPFVRELVAAGIRKGGT
jgi:chromosomal replication initiation ATPase DnaA